MSDLQVAITAVAAIAVLWVLVSNQRERPRGRSIPPPSATPAEPAVHEAPTVPMEPSLGGDGARGNAGTSGNDGAPGSFVTPDGNGASADGSVATTGLEPHAHPASEVLPVIAAAERLFEPVLPSAIGESIAELSWPSPVAAGPVLHAIRGWRHVGSKPLSFGWRLPDAAAFIAEPPQDRIIGLQVGILLATRSGPMHAMEYTDWNDAMMRLASDHGAQLTIPAMHEVLARAREVDRACAEVDSQLAIALGSDAGLSPVAIDAAAREIGLEVRGESRYAKGPLHHQRFSVFPGDGGMGLVLLLDVPRTAAPVEAFDEMLSAGRALADALSAELTDEAGRLLLPEDIVLIREQLIRQEARILAIGITPGSTLAQRLFL